LSVIYPINQRAYVETALTSSSLGDAPFETLCLVARYYRDAGHTAAETEALLITFLTRCVHRADPERWKRSLSLAVRNAEKYTLSDADAVTLTAAELDAVAALPRHPHRRLLVALICFARYNSMSHTPRDPARARREGWVWQPDKEIFRAANVRTTTQRQSLMLSDLHKEGLVEFGRAVDDTHVRVLCLRPDAAPALQISDLRNLGEQYRRFEGAACVECAACGLVIRRQGNRQKYCAKCADDINRDAAKKRWYSSIRNCAEPVQNCNTFYLETDF
jgi:hypothetical protein